MYKMLLSIFLYVICCCFVLLCTCKISRDRDCLLYGENNKLGRFAIVLIAALFTVYNCYCTIVNGTISERDGGDRYNYYCEFCGVRETSEGLTFIFDLVKSIGGKFEIVLYLTSFICCLITFFTYKLSKNESIYVLIFLLLTDIIFTMFVNLKQCYANVFIALAMILMMGEHKLYKDVVALVLAVISLQFHSIAIIALPVLVLLRFNGWQNKRFVLICIITIILGLMIEPLSIKLSELVRPIYPYGADKLLEYFGEKTSHVDEGSIFSFIKGAPFYIISVVGLVNRKKLKPICDNYDSYLFLTILGSLFYFLSIASYWMYRATCLFYLPMAIFFGVLCKNLNGKNKFVFAGSVLGINAVVFFRWLILLYINYGGF